MAKDDKGRTTSIRPSDKSETDASKSIGSTSTPGLGPNTGVGSTNAPGVAQAQAILAERKTRGPYTKRGTGDKAQAQAQALAKMEGIAAQLYSPENFKHIVELPGDIGFAITGHEHWLLGEKESASLASTGSVAAQLLALDPRWMAFILFATNVAGCYGARVVKEVFVRREEKKKKQSIAPVKTDAV